jgi:hypothetical protein
LAELQRSPATPLPATALPGQLADLRDLLIAYLRQETLEPVQQVGRYVAFGLASSACLCVAFVLIGLAGLRALQNETGDHLTGNWSWVPYLIVAIYAVAVIAWAVSRIAKRPPIPDPGP